MDPYILIALGFAVSLAVCGFMVIVGISDQPDHRSNHSEITPTGGGLGFIATMGLVVFIYTQSSDTITLSPDFAQILSLVWAIGFLGLMDDILNLSAIFKLILLLAISIAAVWAIGPVMSLPFGGASVELPAWLAWAGSVLWVFGVMNVVNFMDGSNGLMLVVMGLSSFFMAWLALQFGALEPYVFLLIACTAIAGLAVYNLRPKALIFSGDVGSLSIGFIYAVAVIWIVRDAQGGNPVYLGPVLILPFLADAFFTMMRRARRGEKLMQAHSTHLYQRMIKGGQSHLRVAFFYGAAVLILAFYVRKSVAGGFYEFINFPIFPALVLSSVYMLVGRRFS